MHIYTVCLNIMQKEKREASLEDIENWKNQESDYYDSEIIGITNSTNNGNTYSELTTSNTFTTSLTNVRYPVKVKVVDKAGNKTEYITSTQNMPIYDEDKYKYANRPTNALILICNDNFQMKLTNADGSFITISKGDLALVPKSAMYSVEFINPPTSNNIIDSFTLNFLIKDSNGNDILLDDTICKLASDSFSQIESVINEMSRVFNDSNATNLCWTGCGKLLHIEAIHKRAMSSLSHQCSQLMPSFL